MSPTVEIFEWETSSNGADRLHVAKGLEWYPRSSKRGADLDREIIAEGPAWDAQPGDR